MTCVIMDNWELQLAMQGCLENGNQESENGQKALSDLLMALILWDEIYYPYGTDSLIWHSYAYKFQLTEILKPLPEDEGWTRIMSKTDFMSNFHVQDYPPIVVEGALRYLLMSNYFQTNYLPSPERADFLLKQAMNPQFFSRMDLVQYVDQKVQEVYQSINQELKREVIKFSMPLLSDYIFQNTQYPKNIFMTAIDIRNTQEAVQFRKWLNDLDDAINEGNILEIKHALNIVSSVVEDFKKTIDLTNHYSIDISLGLSPSVEFPVPIKFGNKPRKIHTTFLKKLVAYGLSARKQTILF